jgi:thiol-disulfide isomerase/thioredoxin
MARNLITLHCLAILLIHSVAPAQSRPVVTTYRAALIRPDSARIVFMVEERKVNGGSTWYFLNAGDRLEAKNIRQRGDSVFVDMPFFESGFEGRRQKDGAITGIWRKGTAGTEVTVPFVADPNQKERFPVVKGPARYDIQGRWRGEIISPNGLKEDAVVDFKQKGNRVTGTFVINSGDYRYLEGVVTGDSLVMSTFDGSHAYLFSATLGDANTISNGVFHAGATAKKTWSAVRDAKAEVDLEETAAHLKPGQSRLDFRFPDLDSNLVSINDDRFKGKVVVIQIMGSWCPNCVDETAYLSQYLKKNRHRGVEMIALAYEYSTDFARSVRSLRKFQERFAMDYPILVSGVKVGDSLRTEKTLPQITQIKTFPTTIFVGKDGQVKKIANDFFGPATGKYYEEYKKSFEATIDELLRGG